MVADFLKRRGGVKFLLLFEGWLMRVDRWLKCDRKRLISGRRRSISGAHGERLQEMLNSTLLKRGPFMVFLLKGRCFSQ